MRSNKGEMGQKFATISDTLQNFNSAIVICVSPAMIYSQINQ